MKKLFFIAIATIGVASLSTSCGGSASGTDSTAADSNKATTGATSTGGNAEAAAKLTALFGGNVFWGITMSSSKDDVAKLSPPNSDNSGGMPDRGIYRWGNKDGEVWYFGVELDDKKTKIAKIEMDIESKDGATANALGQELAKMIEAKFGKHTNEDTSENTDFQWTSADASAYLSIPAKDSKDTRVSYANELTKK